MPDSYRYPILSARHGIVLDERVLLVRKILYRSLQLQPLPAARYRDAMFAERFQPIPEGVHGGAVTFGGPLC